MNTARLLFGHYFTSKPGERHRDPEKDEIRGSAPRGPEQPLRDEVDGKARGGLQGECQCRQGATYRDVFDIGEFMLYLWREKGHFGYLGG